MTDKKRRKRGSRTHGGGSHKNRRGAGHRGGRGAAGRAKHEFHNHEPLGKSGFTRPEKAQEEVAEIDLQEIDENAALWAADGDAEADGDGFRLDARDVVEDGHEVDVVKVLGANQLHSELTVVADDFSESAADLLESEGGEAVLTDRGQERQERLEAAEETDDDEETE